jgi:hypothetical protein
MQLDRTCIAVRERGAADTMDLALHVLRAYFSPLFVTLVIGALPFAVLNQFLIGWMLRFDADMIISGEAAGQVPRYIWTMIVLVVIEAPLASAFVTTCLGQAMFLERPNLRMVLVNVFRMAGRLAWCHLLPRGLLPALLLILAIDRHASFSSAEVWLLFLWLLVCLRRALRPYVSEIVLLEHLPFRKGAKDRMTISRRNLLLHGPGGGDLVYRWLATSFFAVLLVVGLLGAIVSLQGIFLHQGIPGLTTLQLGLPLALWLVAGLVAVVRFLNYLDLRIRLEGWEVELRMRAEASRLFGE